MKRSFSLIIAFLAYQFAGATYLMDMVNQTVVAPLFQEKPKYNISAAFGISNRINNLSFNAGKRLAPTNGNAYLLGLDIDGNSTFLSLPFTDPRSSRDSRVDSKFFKLNSAFNLTPKLKFEINYDTNTGYFFDAGPDLNEPVISFPNLAFETASIGLFYTLNENHKSFLFTPLLFRKSASSSSWIVGFDVIKNKISGLSSLQKFPEVKYNTDLSEASVYALSSGIAYSKTAYFDKWFVAGALGVYVNLNQQFIRFFNAATKSKNNSSTSSKVNLSGGYLWSRGVVGAFVAPRSWSNQIEELEVATTDGRNGLYMTYLF